jgi:hypothetical protein
MSWYFLFKPPGGHKFFRDERGRIGIADDSGSDPTNTDDGVIYLDRSRPVILFDYVCGSYSHDTGAYIPILVPGVGPTPESDCPFCNGEGKKDLEDRGNDGEYAICGVTEAILAASTFGMRVKIKMREGLRETKVRLFEVKECLSRARAIDPTS